MTLSDTNIYEHAPHDFIPKLQVAACYLEFDGKLLVLKRSEEKIEGGKWGVPAGKLEQDESPHQAALRELKEETAIMPAHPSHVRYLRTLCIRKPHIDYLYHMFYIHLDQQPQVVLSQEHKEYAWASEQERAKLELMDGAHKLIEYYKAAMSRLKRVGASVNAYLILEQDGKLLLQLRQNTGYCDGMWSLIAGHVEEVECATEGMIREAQEEIGLLLEPTDLKVIHVMHRKTERLNIDIFFQCLSWKGQIRNCEPHKCDGLDFFSLDQLPSNLVEHNGIALKAIQQNQIYSEFGWT
ncbi:MAG: NUDIX hydrolase [Verrucomicrobia bacterium]|nr:NUDIX hydrolase [Verrucomicrobiota bacterium]MBS0645762.1 NUDIX hydrolase [Verrucomicrobiota bacterium]